MAKLTKKSLALLLVIVAAGENGTYGKTAELQPLVDGGLVEVNPGATNDAGEVAVRATGAGVELAGSSADTSNGDGGAPTVKSTFTIDDDVALPAGATRTKAATYPFELLGVNQSFFVGNTEAKPNAAKSLASTISSANKRYTTEDGSGNRKFVVRPVDETAQGRGKGARIWRTL